MYFLGPDSSAPESPKFSLLGTIDYTSSVFQCARGGARHSFLSIIPVLHQLVLLPCELASGAKLNKFPSFCFIASAGGRRCQGLVRYVEGVGPPTQHTLSTKEALDPSYRAPPCIIIRTTTTTKAVVGSETAFVVISPRF